MKIDAPERVTRQIAERATAIARSWSMARGWKIGVYLSPTYKNGSAGISATRKYIYYQNSGTKPFLMKALEGKVVPVGRRLLTVRGVGEPGWVNIPEFVNDGKRSYPGLRKVWREQKWRHPGIKPKHFLENSIQHAIWEQKGEMEKLTQELLMGNAEYIAQLEG